MSFLHVRLGLRDVGDTVRGAERICERGNPGVPLSPPPLHAQRHPPRRARREVELRDRGGLVAQAGGGGELRLVPARVEEVVDRQGGREAAGVPRAIPRASYLTDFIRSK